MVNENLDRADILDAAKICVCTDRNEQYGEPEENFAVIADLWNKYCGTKFKENVHLSAFDVAIMMALFKIARSTTATKQKADTFIDIAGYVACAGEIALRE